MVTTAVDGGDQAHQTDGVVNSCLSMVGVLENGVRVGGDVVAGWWGLQSSFWTLGQV